jgi:hypothetical protein
MSNGYQVIEPTAVERWLPIVRNREFVVALLHWIVQQIRPVLMQERPELFLEVMAVTYYGTYPALGLRFADGHDGDNRTYEGEDLEPRIQQMVTDLMATARLSDFMDFATHPNADWSRINPDSLPSQSK